MRTDIDTSGEHTMIQCVRMETVGVLLRRITSERRSSRCVGYFNSSMEQYGTFKETFRTAAKTEIAEPVPKQTAAAPSSLWYEYEIDDVGRPGHLDGNLALKQMSAVSTRY